MADAEAANEDDLWSDGQRSNLNEDDYSALYRALYEATDAEDLDAVERVLYGIGHEIADEVDGILLYVVTRSP